MERNNFFEQLLKNEVDELRMQPSQKIWNNVQQNIGSKFKPTALALIALFALLITLQLIKPTVPLTNSYANNFYQTNYNNNNIISEVKKSDELVAKNNTEFNNKNNAIINKTIQEATVKVLPTNVVISKQRITKDITIDDKNISNIVSVSLNNSNIDFSKKEDSPTIINSNNLAQSYIIENNATEQTNALNNPNSINELLSLSTINIEKPYYKATLNNISILPQNVLVNTITKDKIKLKSKAQFYLTTGIAYRMLYDKRGVNSQIPFSTQTTSNSSLNASVFHKPATSIETGVAWVKPIAKKIEFKIGVQSNYDSYKIKASNGQAQLATINLSSNGSGSQVNTVSTIRNAEGMFPRWIENSNITLSMPVGLNFIAGNSTKVKFGFGATVQPSIIIKSKMLLLSTDFKNYIDAPYLVRKINVNTAIEPFIAISRKKLQYQFGPQLRYQLMSSYHKKYPFKENLFNYGFKVAISKPF